MTTFTYLIGERPDGFSLDQGFGFAGNFGYWYIDYVAERPGFTDHWMTEIAGGVRLNIGDQARFSDEVDRTEHYIDFLGDAVRLNAKDALMGRVTQIDMGAHLGGEDIDFFRITEAANSAKHWRKAIADFIANPDDNIDFQDSLTRKVAHIVGETNLDNHGGFPSEVHLRSMAMGTGDDLVIWQGQSLGTVTLDGGDGVDLLGIFTDAPVKLSVTRGTVTAGEARATFTGFENFTVGDGADTLIGSNGNDQLRDLAGSNLLRGLAGDDALAGGINRDRLKGGAGDDWLFGSLGRDRLVGGPGDDTLQGGRDDDTLVGGPGADHFVINRSYVINVEAGSDRIVDFDPKEDILDLRAFEWFDSPQAVRAQAKPTAEGLLIDVTTGQDLLLRGVVLDDLTEANLFLALDVG